MALFCAIAIHSSPQCGLSQGFAGYDKWRFFRGLRNGLTPIFEKPPQSPVPKDFAEALRRAGLNFNSCGPKIDTL